ncbi:Na+-dependent transporter [Rhodopseudomonas palustris]|uniref:Na+-dependent transporter n=1 Tax=Rhodopseudomonas palustris TaxID=1076 RepID=A0A323UGL0_RHOPL|nr:Na+-dependent transporter [Rhodopseudomonas palustris]PZA11499.1 Na+-dependent transporter [Rhodopseudomonas palustris]
MSVGLLRGIAIPVKGLAWIGRQGTRAIAALVVLGLAVPPLGDALRPFVTEAIFALLCISFMRVDVAQVRANLRRPAVVLAATAWTALAVPVLAGLACFAARLDVRAPDLLLALMLQAVASPMMASPALAALMGLDATLVLMTLVTSTALIPFTAPLFAYVFVGSSMTLSPLALGLKLSAILGGSLLVAAIIRKLVGAEAIHRQKQPIDGANILILYVFVAAVMGNVVSSVIAQPLLMIALAALAFAVFLVLLVVTTLMFRKIGPDRALALGLMVSQRNMGLMVAATDGALPGVTWLYFALSQFPIYLAPQLLAPVARKVVAGRARSVDDEEGAVSSAGR